MELSIYTLVFTRKGKFYIYNSRSNFFSEISVEMYRAMVSQCWDSLPNEVVEELKKRELICENSSKYDYYYSELIAFNDRNNNRTHMELIIAPTTACNFACPYCFESKNNPMTMDDLTIDALADFVKSQEDVKNLSITWYGGEPLLAFDKMKSIYNKLSSDGMPSILSQALITNGYCFNDEIISFFKEKGCRYIQITIDGLYERHSATRCLKNSSKSTFEPIISNIDKLVSELPETRINIRVNINKNNYKEYISVVNFFKKRYPGNKRISAYPGIIREENIEGNSLCDTSFGTSEMLTLNALLRREGLNTSDFPRKRMRGCMMQSRNSYLIGPIGEIYKCWNDVGNPDAIIGNIKSNELNNPSRYIKYTIRAVPFNSECRDCHAFPICEGGCSYFRYRNMFEGCHFDLCSPYKDKEKLIDALLSGEFDI